MSEAKAMTNLNHDLLNLLPDLPLTTVVALQSLSDLQKLVDILQKLFTIAAIIVGGIWTYFNFFQGRTYKMRLEPNVSGKVVTINELSHLVATISVKNVGLSKVEIEQKGSALKVLSYEAWDGVNNILSIEWQNLTAFPVFETHQWIEPGEEITEQRLLVIPKSEYTAFQLQLRIVSKKAAWRAMDIVTLGGESVYEKEGGENA
jgi:hypothetical protein